MSTFDCGCKTYCEPELNRCAVVETFCDVHKTYGVKGGPLYLAACGCYLAFTLETPGRSWVEVVCSAHGTMHTEYNLLDQALTNERSAVYKKYDALMKPYEDACPLLNI